MASYTTKQLLAEDWLPDDYNELVKVHKVLAQAADKRLMRLESYSHEKGFKTADKWAYARAMKDIQMWSGSEAKRFDVKPPTSKTDLVSKIQDIKHFLESPTSTKQGIISVYKKKADSLNKTMRAEDPNWKDLTWKDMSQYFESKLHEKIDSEYGSGDKFEVLNTLKKNKKQILEDIKEKKDIHVKVEDEVLQITIDDILSQYPKEVEKLLKNL